MRWEVRVLVVFIRYLLVSFYMVLLGEFISRRLEIWGMEEIFFIVGGVGRDSDNRYSFSLK